MRCKRAALASDAFGVVRHGGMCASQGANSMTYRLGQNRNRSQVLVPPRVAKADLAQRTFRSDRDGRDRKNVLPSPGSPSPLGRVAIVTLR